jgi:hypothetical protein
MFKSEFSMYYLEDDEDVQYEIQKMYQSNFPDMLSAMQYNYSGEKFPNSRSALSMFLPVETQSELNFLQKHFSVRNNRNKIVKLAEEIVQETKSEINRSKAEVDLIEKMVEQGKIDQLDANFLRIFNKYYGTVSKVPVKSTDTMLELNYIQNYPINLQKVINKGISSNAAKIGKKIRESKIVESKQSSILVKLQTELLKEAKTDT